MSSVSSPRFLVLHSLRVKGFATPEGVAAASGLPESTVEDGLRSLQDEGFATYRSGRVMGWSLTEQGRVLAEALEQVEMGNMEWFTGALIESYHTVWFELHEDLLATLAIERAREVAR